MVFDNMTFSFSGKMVWQLLFRGSGVGRKETVITSLSVFLLSFLLPDVCGLCRFCVVFLCQLKSCQVLCCTTCQGCLISGYFCAFWSIRSAQWLGVLPSISVGTKQSSGTDDVIWIAAAWCFEGPNSQVYNLVPLFKFQIHRSTFKSLSVLEFCNIAESVVCLSWGHGTMSDYN